MFYIAYKKNARNAKMNIVHAGYETAEKAIDHVCSMLYMEFMKKYGLCIVDRERNYNGQTGITKLTVKPALTMCAPVEYFAQVIEK